MSHCVPSLNLDDQPPPTSACPSLCSHSNYTAPADVPMSDYEVAELTWENGQLAMHGLGPPRSSLKPLTSASPASNKYNNTRGSGTLESIVNQATRVVHYCKLPSDTFNNEVDLVPWVDNHRTVAAAVAATASASATTTMDALVPGSNQSTDHPDPTTRVMDQSMHPAPGPGTKCVLECSTGVSSCSGVANQQGEDGGIPRKRVRTARLTSLPEWSGRDHSFSGSATFGRDRERDLGVGFTSTSQGSLENTSSGKPSANATTTVDDHDSVCHSRPQV